MLAVGIIWCLFMLYGIVLLINPFARRMRAWELRYKPVKLPRLPTYPQRIIFFLLTLLMVSVAMAAAFHLDLRALIGINSGQACSLMIILPMLYFAFGFLPHRKNGPESDT